MTRAELLRKAAARLAAAGIEEPALEARWLLAWAAELDRSALAARLDAPPDAPERARFEAALARRVARVPMAQIIGEREFWGRPFRVTADVLDPRPETETLIEAALAGPPARRILDLGTGSGCLLVTLLAEWPEATGLGIDLSVAALAVARHNAARHGVAERAEFLLGNWAEDLDERFDLVVSNPPYLAEDEFAQLAPEVREHEPRAALAGGPDGLEAYRRMAPDLPRLLVPGGRVLLEVGAGQAAAVTRILARAGLMTQRTHRDLGGHDRVLEASARQNHAARGRFS